MLNIKSIDELVNIVIKNIDPSYTTLEKIRYVYLSVGKYLQKDTDFFLSLDGKLEELNLDSDELFRIYNDDKTIQTEQTWNKVICKSAALVLKMCYDKLGISSKLIETTGFEEIPSIADFEVHHFFLSVKDELDNSYFLTLAADLPYIQNGMLTRHFATYIPYYKEDKNGKKVQMYFGDEIVPTVLTSEELRKIDRKLGYLQYQYKVNSANDIIDGNERKAYENAISKGFLKPKLDFWDLDYVDRVFEELKKDLIGDTLYYKLIEEHTEFYNSILNEDSTFNFSNATKEDWDNVLNKICKSINERFGSISNGKFNYDFNNYSIDDFMNYAKNNSSSDIPYDMRSLVGLLNGMSSSIDSYYSKIGPKTKEEIVQFKNSFFNKIHKLSDFFIEPDAIFFDRKGYLPNAYIQNKFSILFEEIFSSNYGIKTDFNKQSYSEQVVIIKYVISSMFSTLSRKNCLISEDKYDEKYSPIFNRLHIYPLKNIKSDDYSIVFRIFGKKEIEDDVFFLYNLKDNLFKRLRPSEIALLTVDNIIVSNTFKSLLSNIENIESNHDPEEEIKPSHLL